MTRDLSDPTDTWWTIDQTAEHFGITAGAVRRWIREDGLTVYGKSKLIARSDALLTFRSRKQKQVSTRGKPHDSGPAHS